MSEQSETKQLPPNPDEDSSQIVALLELDLNQFPEYRQNSSFAWQRDGSRYSLHSVQDAVRRGYLTLEDFRQVIDFGAGGGGPTFLLDQICKITKGNVEALENDPDQLKSLKVVVPSIPVYEGNGLEELARMSGSASLITAFTFGPDWEGDFFPKLADAAQSALTDEGKLLIFSDKHSEENIFNILTTSGVTGNDLKVVPEQNQGDTYKFIPRTAIISKHGLSLISHK